MLQEKIDKRKSREIIPIWCNPEEEKLALDKLYSALCKQKNDKDYYEKINKKVQKMFTGELYKPVFIKDNSDTQDELEHLLEELEEYDIIHISKKRE